MRWFNYVWVAVAFGSFSIQPCQAGITAIYTDTTVTNSNPTPTGLTTTVNQQQVSVDTSNGTLGTAYYGNVSSNRLPGSTNNNASNFNYNSQVTIQSGGMITPTQYGVINIGGTAQGTEFYNEFPHRLALTNNMYVVVNGTVFTGDNISFSLAVGDKFLNLSVRDPNVTVQYFNFGSGTSYFGGNNTVYNLSVDGDFDGDFDGLTDEALYQIAPPVPEPSSVVMLSIGGIGMGLAAWRRNRLSAT